MIDSGQDEQTLIQQAQRGSLEAFNALILRYQDSLYSTAYRILGDPDSAADATQDALISAYRRLSTFQGGHFKAWLARIVTNVCYDELRRQKRQRADYLDDLPGGDSDDGAPLPASTPTPEQLAGQNELHRAIQSCINSLGSDQRLVLVLSDIQGFSYQEIADQVNSNLGTVKSRLSRARLAVRRCLQGYAELLPAEFRLFDDSNNQ
jgi:RNA polymerase sigma-70 factor (ECF subfamily)